MRRMFMSLVFLFCAVVVLNASLASAQTIGSAQNFAVLGASTVTNTGATLATGDVGVSPGTAITGFPPGVVVGAIHAGDIVAAQAHADAAVAYARLKALPCPAANNLTGQVLGTAVTTLRPGTYCFDSSAQLTGPLLLLGAGPWVFQIGSTLTTSSNSQIVLFDDTVDNSLNCGSNVFWQVSSSATLGTNTQFVGNILALASITATTGVRSSGSLLALTAAVTLDTNILSACVTATVPPDPDPDPDECKCKCKCKHHGRDGHDDCDDDGHHHGDHDGHHGDNDDDDHHGHNDHNGHGNDRNSHNNDRDHGRNSHRNR